MLQAGDVVPDFVLPSDTIGDVNAAGLRGQRFVLYFYPKDDTTGCTIEACNFRDNLARFNSVNVPVYGISPDNVKSHLKFRAKFGLTFPLLADTEHKVAEAFGAWVEKSMYGRKYMGIQRSTFVIGPAGAIERVWEKVTPAEHARDVLAYLSGIAAPATNANSRMAIEPADESAARAAAFEEIVTGKTEVTEVITETVNDSTPANAPEPVVKAPKKPARKKSAAMDQAAPEQVAPAAQTAPELVEVVMMESITETPGGTPVDVIEVFAVEAEPVVATPAARKPAAKKTTPAAKKVAAKKPAAKKVAAKKRVATAKKPATKKAVGKKPTVAAKKPSAAVKKPAAKKPAAAAKKPAAKR